MNTDIKRERFMEAVRLYLNRAGKQFSKKSKGVLLVDPPFDCEEITNIDSPGRDNWYWMKDILIHNKQRAAEIEKLYGVSEDTDAPKWGICYQIRVPQNQIKAWLKYKPEMIERLEHDVDYYEDKVSCYVFRNMYFMLERVKYSRYMEMVPSLLFTNCFDVPYLERTMTHCLNGCIYQVRKFAENYKKFVQEVYMPLMALQDSGKAPEIIEILNQLNDSQAA